MHNLKHTVRAAALLACVGFALPVFAAQAAGLNAPFTAVAPVLKKDKVPECGEAVPAPVISLSVTSIYDQTDDSRSTIDPDQFDEYTEGMAALRDFQTAVTKDASDYVQTGGKKLEAAVCGVIWLDAWAKADALSNLGTRQSALSSTRIVAGLGIAFLSLKPVAAAMKFDTSNIEAWFGRRAKDLMEVYAGRADLGSNRSNHRYWGGFAVAVSGVVTGDRSLLDWGIESYRIGVCQVEANGALPLELKRAKKSRDYHLHAIAPLVMIAELAESNGVDAYGFCDGAMHRLVKFALQAVTDPTEIEKLSGAKQIKIPTKNGAFRGDRFAWVEPYFKRFGGSESDYGFELSRPLFSSNLGGRLTSFVKANAG